MCLCLFCSEPCWKKHRHQRHSTLRTNDSSCKRSPLSSPPQSVLSFPYFHFLTSDNLMLLCLAMSWRMPFHFPLQLSAVRLCLRSNSSIDLDYVKNILVNFFACENYDSMKFVFFEATTCCRLLVDSLINCFQIHASCCCCSVGAQQWRCAKDWGNSIHSIFEVLSSFCSSFYFVEIMDSKTHTVVIVAKMISLVWNKDSETLSVTRMFICLCDT